MGYDRSHDAADMHGRRNKETVIPGYEIPQDGAEDTWPAHHLGFMTRVDDTFAEVCGNLGDIMAPAKFTPLPDYGRLDAEGSGGDAGGDGVGVSWKPLMISKTRAAMTREEQEKVTSCIFQYHLREYFTCILALVAGPLQVSYISFH
jgi:hypothetical protein